MGSGINHKDEVVRSLFSLLFFLDKEGSTPFLQTVLAVSIPTISSSSRELLVELCWLFSSSIILKTSIPVSSPNILFSFIKWMICLNVGFLGNVERKNLWLIKKLLIKCTNEYNNIKHENGNKGSIIRHKISFIFIGKRTRHERGIFLLKRIIMNNG